MRKLQIAVGELVLEAELYEGPTARQVWAALPIEGEVSTWGEEIYFTIPVVAGQEPGARADVEVGELGYWPVGHAFCVFFGPTPVSRGGKPRAYSPVNILGRITSEVSLLKSLKTIRDGAVIRLTAE